MIKIAVGTQKKSHKIKEEEKRKTAYHEAGHAICSHILPTQDPVRQISIIPSGQALGYTLNSPTEDKYSVYKKQLTEEIIVLLAGRAAEKIVFDDISGGASNDIQRATDIARKMVTTYGMSDILGTIHLGGNHTSDEVFLGRDFNSTQNYSEKTAALIDDEIKRIIDESYARAIQILTENRDKLDFISEFLVKHEIMSDEEFKLAMDGISMEELEEFTENVRKQSEEENATKEKDWQIEQERIKAEEAKKAQENKKPQNDQPRFPWEN
ncbi:MAG: hypothetical protein MJ236_00380 [Clostridia bacterium]|nr:hypothetical protein [Clostridia bacterium]